MTRYQIACGWLIGLLAVVSYVLGRWWKECRTIVCVALIVALLAVVCLVTAACVDIVFGPTLPGLVVPNGAAPNGGSS